MDWWPFVCLRFQCAGEVLKREGKAVPVLFDEILGCSGFLTSEVLSDLYVPDRG